MGGGMMEGTLGVGYAKTVLDFEQLDAFYHFCQGPQFEDMDDVFDTIQSVGPGGHFLGTAHTRRSNLFIFPSQNNTTFEQWEAEGCKSSEQVGIEKARTWLDRYEPPEMDSSLKEGLDDFVNERESAIPNTLE